MKKLALLILLVATMSCLKAQSIVGRWQAGLATLSDEYLENYQFFADGTFCFNTNGEDGLSRIEKICGTYYIENNMIVFKVRYYSEKTGGSLKLDGAEPGTAAWKFKNHKINKVLINNATMQKVRFKLYKEQDISIIEIDESKYYKVQNDPDKYF